MSDARQKGADARQLLKLALMTLLIATALCSGVVHFLNARNALLEARGKYISTQSEAASLPREARELEQTKREWNEEKKGLWRSAETGITIKDIEDAVVKSGAKLISVEPGGSVVGAFRGHLRAVPVKVGMKGTYPAVLAAVSSLEQLANPGEARQFRITSVKDSEAPVPGEVEANVDLVLYSLNPPEAKEKVSGNSGRYDPFFPLIVSKEQIVKLDKANTSNEVQAPQSPQAQESGQNPPNTLPLKIGQNVRFFFEQSVEAWTHPGFDALSFPT